MNLGSWKLDDYLPIIAATHRFSTGAAYAPSAITYAIYSVGTDGDLTQVKAATAMTNRLSKTGVYAMAWQLSTGNGFAKGGRYVVLLEATVDGVAAISWDTFQIEAEVDANSVSDAGVATASAVSTVDGKVDTIDGVVDGIDGKVDTIDGVVDGIAGTVATNLDAAVSTRSTLDAAAVRSEADDALAAILLDCLIKNPLPNNYATDVDVDSGLAHILENGSDARYDRTEQSNEIIRQNMAAVSDFVDGVFAKVCETGISFFDAVRIVLAVIAGKSTGFGVSGDKVFRNPADSKDRVTAQTDGSGNRTSVAFDLT